MALPARRTMGSMESAQLDDRGIVVSCSGCGQKNRVAFARLIDAARCGQCKQPITLPDAPIEVHSSALFDRIIGEASLPVLVDYWAPWCGPCRMVAPELKKVASRQAGRVIVLKVNTDELSDLGQRFGIRSIPTMAVFSGGREVTRSAGARPANEIEMLLDQAVAQR
jgi:thioredoxin 2